MSNVSLIGFLAPALAAVAGLLSPVLAADQDSQITSRPLHADLYPRSNDCGAWPSDLTATYSNEHFVNYGCSVRANIAAMVANPRDLVTGRRMSNAPAGQRVIAVQSITDNSDASGGNSSSSSSSASSNSTSP